MACERIVKHNKVFLLVNDKIFLNYAFCLFIFIVDGFTLKVSGILVNSLGHVIRTIYFLYLS